jgi:glutamate 5-kinase
MLAEKPHGWIHIDMGAARKLVKGGASLLPVGITRIEGTFERGELVGVTGADGRLIAHGLTSYNSSDIQRLCGVKSNRIGEILGYSYGDAVIHRNNLILLG